MAEDRLLLNFEIGTDPLKLAPQFRGGSWRDRSRAKRAAAAPKQQQQDQQQQQQASNSSEHADPDGLAEPPKKRHKKDPIDQQRDIHPSSQPAPKSHANGASRGNGGGGGGTSGTSSDKSHPRQGRQVTSRLFTSNPAPKTTLDESAAAWTAPDPSNAPLPNAEAFSSLGLAPRLVTELGRMNMDRPTAIQETVIPVMLTTCKDAFVQAETGSGKTFAYLLPILHRVLAVTESGAKLHRDSGLFAVVITPTRELAKQTQTVLEEILRPFPWLVSSAITGGESKKAEKARFRKGVNFLVATPGRLADHLDNTKALDFRTVRWLVLDEGDRLMELGFEDDLRKVITCLKRVKVATRTPDGVSLVAALPDRRVTILCSATMKVDVQRLGEMSLADAAYLEAKTDRPRNEDGAGTGAASVPKAPDQLHQVYTVVPAKLRLVTLISHLKSIFSRRRAGIKVIVFITCADSVNFHFDLLKLGPLDRSGGPPAAAETAETTAEAAYITSPATPALGLYKLHGSLPQPIRTATLKAFTSSTVPSVLLTTDIASRGLDIPSVDTVIEYDPAFSSADHIHRVGRTARAGRSGDAMLFLLPGCEESYLELIGSSAAFTARPYEKILESGLSSLAEYPFETHAKATDGRSCHQRAESLQLHLEQRLQADARMQELARSAFKSHIRAYATHVKAERDCFNISELHLGHFAKAFGLREAPAGIGGGVDRKAKKRSGKKGDGDQWADLRASRAAVFKKSRSIMSGADEFNLG